MRDARFLAAAVLAAAFLSGCGLKAPSPAATPSPSLTGLAAMSPQEVLETSIAALTKAGSYRVIGDLVVDGLDMIVDIRVQASDAVAHIKMGDQGSVTFVNVGGMTYVQGDDAFWRQVVGSKAAAAMKGKWAMVKRGDAADMVDFNQITEPERLLKLDGVEKLVVSDRASVAGTPAIVLKDERGIGVFYVAAQGEPYPLRLNATVYGKLDFSEFGATFDIQAPPADEVVRL